MTNNLADVHELAVEDDVFLRNEGHLFYVKLVDKLGHKNYNNGKIFEGSCKILFGKTERYSGKCLIEVKIDRGEPMLLVLVPGQSLGHSFERKEILLGIPEGIGASND